MSSKEKECPSCAMNVPRDEKVCPICGYEFPDQSSTFKFAVVVMTLIFILLILWGVVKYY